MECGSEKSKLLLRQALLGALLLSFLSIEFIFIPRVYAWDRKASSHTPRQAKSADEVERDAEGRRVVYKQRNVVDFDAMLLEGDIRNPNEFYFVHRPEEKFGSLVKRRKNFHKEMLRDSVMIR